MDSMSEDFGHVKLDIGYKNQVVDPVISTVKMVNKKPSKNPFYFLSPLLPSLLYCSSEFYK